MRTIPTFSMTPGSANGTMVNLKVVPVERDADGNPKLGKMLGTTGMPFRTALWFYRFQYPF